MAITYKSPEEIAVMRQTGRIVAQILEILKDSIRPGMTTADLDRIAERHISLMGATPSFKGYRGFPACICVSINNEIVHGIPGPRVLQENDVVSLDAGAVYRGFHADSAITVALGQPDEVIKRLVDTTRGALMAGITAAREGNRIGDISWAVQTYVEKRHLAVVREYVGHGVGRQLHEDPQVPNFGESGRGLALREGLVIAIEPMVNIGTWKTNPPGEDGWTVTTADGSLSAHFEHTIAVTNQGPEILTSL